MTVRALLFTDVVDSTLLVERLGDARAAELWTEHDRRARQLLAQHRGREIDRTDGFFLLFDQAIDAVRYAVDYHRVIAGLELAARVGIHVGAVTLRENDRDDVARGAKPTEVEGIAKPFAARLMALARGGQTLLSASAVSALDGVLGDMPGGAPGDALPEGTEITSHGHYRLKGVEAPVEAFELGARGQSAFAPPQDADKAYRVVWMGDLWRPVREVRHNLPAERNAFIGRGTELHALALRLDAGARLVSVVGSGGTGKTRFVGRYAWTWLGDWPGGIYFCDLSEARSLDGIFFAMAFALGVPLGQDDPAVQLGHAIAGRGRCLVILDNFEQVVEHAPATLGRWLDRAGDAAFVVTSRERLHLPGEEVFPIEPLPLDKDAIELFVARARAQQPEFALTEANRDAVARIVTLLDGLPLAIELAAARVRLLSPARIVERMRDRFALLAGARGVAARQATLRAVIDWSWDLLAPWEQAALAQCSVFEGGFTLDAAEAVLDLSLWAKVPPTMDAVQALVDKSLLRTWVPAQQGRYDIDEHYFGMYLSIHEYAADKLRTCRPGAQRAAHDQHGKYFSRFGTEKALDALFRHGGRQAPPSARDRTRQPRRRLPPGGGPQRRRDGGRGLPGGLGNLGILHRDQGRVHEARAHYDQALAIHREVGNRSHEGIVLCSLGNLYRDQGRVEEARRHYEDASVIARKVEDRHAEGIAVGNLGNLHRDQGRTVEARAHYQQALATHRAVGNRREEGIVLGNLAGLLVQQGQVAQAREAHRAGEALLRDVGDRLELAKLLCTRGRVDAVAGDLDAARAALAEAETAAAAIGVGPDAELSREIARLRQALA